MHTVATHRIKPLLSTILSAHRTLPPKGIVIVDCSCVYCRSFHRSSCQQYFCQHNLVAEQAWCRRRHRCCGYHLLWAPLPTPGPTNQKSYCRNCRRRRCLPLCNARLRTGGFADFHRIPRGEAFQNSTNIHCLLAAAGSREEAPYTALVDFSTNRRTDGYGATDGRAHKRAHERAHGTE